jgi:histidine triad (HIT) family protein
MPPRHAPDGYQCTFCTIASGGDSRLTTQQHVVYRDGDVTAFVASHWWPANPGHILVIPNRHIENLYELPVGLGGPLMVATQRVALAMKVAYGCEGVSTRQHNEPAGNQDIWHFHQHVFPRWRGDRLYQRHDEKALAPDAAKLERAAALRSAMGPPAPTDHP